MNLPVLKKFNRKVSIADIKKYLVDEFDNNKNLQKQIYELQDELKVTKEFEVKYNLSLVTLDEFKQRIEDTKKRNQELETQIKKLQDKIKEQVYEINEFKLKEKKTNDYLKDVKKNARKDLIKEYREQIDELKGHIKKEDILKIIK